MGIMSPAFREINFANIERLSKTLSDATIASIITDKTGIVVSVSDVAAYYKITRLASNVMLVPKTVVDMASAVLA